MIRAAAVVPHPPLLLPGVGGRSDPLAGLRARCLDAIAVLGDAPVVVLRAPPPPAEYDVAGWLCAAAGIDPVASHVVTAGTGQVSVPDGAALLVFADGSAGRGPRAPAGPQPDAEESDDALAAALAAGDAATLAGYDPPPALLATGAPALRLLGRLAGGRPWRARLLAHEAPFGVAYLVAHWT